MEKNDRDQHTITVYNNCARLYDIVPRSELWKRMTQIRISLEYTTTVARLYEQVRRQLKMDSSFSKYLLSNMGVKQGYPLSPTLFGLLINKLDVIVNQGCKRRRLDGPKFTYELIVILLYADNVIYILDDMQHFDVIDTFCQISWLIINVDKTQMMAIRAI